MKRSLGLDALVLLLAGCSSTGGADSKGTTQPDAGSPSAGGSGGQSVQPPIDSGTSGAGGSAGSGGTGSAGTGNAGPGGGAGQAGAPGEIGTPMQQSVESLLTVRQEHAVVALDGEIYVIGGFTPSATATNAAYDPGTGMWREIADFPAVLHHANAAAVGGKLYVTGFHLGSSFTDADERVYEYDPVADDWTQKTSMPAGSERGSSCVAVLDGLIYVFGGAAASTVAESSVYDPVLDEWQSLPPLPEPREHCVAGAIGGKVYIAAGRSGGITGFEPNTWAYDPVARDYEPLAPIPTPRGGVAGAVLNGRLFVFGGEGNPDLASDGVFPTVEAYAPDTNVWTDLPDMLVPRHGFGAAVVGDRIYLPGGATSQGFGPVADHTEVYFE